MVGYSQEYEHGSFKSSSILDEKLESISKKLFYMALNGSKVYKTSRLLDEADSAHYARVTKNEVLHLVFPKHWPNGIEQPAIDTFISKPFTLKSVSSFAISYKNSKVLSLAPLRYYEKSKQKEPLYWINWEEVRKSISTQDETLIISLAENMMRSQLTKKYLESKDLFYFDSTQNEVRDLMTKAFRKLYENNNDSLKPLIYLDSVFAQELSYLEIENYDLLNFYRIGKVHKSINFDAPIILKDTIHELDFNIESSFVEFGEIQYFQRLNEDRSVDGLQSVWNIYSKKEDFLPLLPEWLQLLMK